MIEKHRKDSITCPHCKKDINFYTNVLIWFTKKKRKNKMTRKGYKKFVLGE